MKIKFRRNGIFVLFSDHMTEINRRGLFRWFFLNYREKFRAM